MAHELKNKFAYQALSSVTQVLLPLIAYPYITRVLGPGYLGKINYVDFVAQMFMIFAAFGIPFYGVREIARVQNNGTQRAALIRELTVLLIVFSTIALLFFAVVAYKAGSGNSTLYWLGAANILLSTFSYDWYVQGMEAFRFTAIRSLLVRLAMLLAFFVFVKAGTDYTIYYGIFTAGYLAITIINISKLLSENSFVKSPLQYRRHLKPLWHFFLTSSAISIYIYFDTILLRQLTHSDAAVGYYTLSLKMVKICQVALLTAGMVLLPRLSFLAGANNRDEIKVYLSKLLSLLLAAGLPLCTILYLLAPEIIEVISGKAFIPAVPVMRILAFLPLVIGLSNLFSFQVLVPFKQEKKFLVAVIAGCITSIGLNLWLIPIFAERGSAYANIITEILITLITGSYALKIIRFGGSLSTMLQTVFCCLLFIPVVAAVRVIAAHPLPVLCVAAAACLIVYYSVQYAIFKNSFIRELQQYISALAGFKK
ncbi:MAG TPA: flippase [Ferruginibacter sp.]|nr:flippase [Ferruginibacter sp.]HMP21275.1 flippase [Ferruginibacter sp.]